MPHSAFDAEVTSDATPASANCVDCHMPKRRTEDVVHAVMTDHYIQRKKPAVDLLAEMKEPHEPEILYRGEVVPYYPQPLPATAENELYLALAQVRENNNMDRGLAQFAAAIKKYRPSQVRILCGARRRMGQSWSRRECDSAVSRSGPAQARFVGRVAGSRKRVRTNAPVGESRRRVPARYSVISRQCSSLAEARRSLRQAKANG